MKILYFAWLREHIGKGEEELDALPENVRTVGALADYLLNNLNERIGDRPG